MREDAKSAIVATLLFIGLAILIPAVVSFPDILQHCQQGERNRVCSESVKLKPLIYCSETRIRTLVQDVSDASLQSRLQIAAYRKSLRMEIRLEAPELAARVTEIQERRREERSQLKDQLKNVRLVAIKAKRNPKTIKVMGAS